MYLYIYVPQHMPPLKAKEMALSWYMEQAELEIWSEDISYKFPILLHYNWPRISAFAYHSLSFILYSAPKTRRAFDNARISNLLLIFVFVNVFQQWCRADQAARICA